MKRLLVSLSLILFAGCSTAPVTYMIHPKTEWKVACDGADWHPEVEGCLAWYCIESIAVRQWVANCVSRQRTAGFITMEEWEARQERAEEITKERSENSHDK